MPKSHFIYYILKWTLSVCTPILIFPSLSQAQCTTSNCITATTLDDAGTNRLYSYTGPDGVVATVQDTVVFGIASTYGVTNNGYKVGVNASTSQTTDRTIVIHFSRPTSCVSLKFTDLTNSGGAVERVGNFRSGNGTLTVTHTNEGVAGGTTYSSGYLSAASGYSGTTVAGRLNISSTEPFISLRFTYDYVSGNPGGAYLNELCYAADPVASTPCNCAAQPTSCGLNIVANQAAADAMISGATYSLYDVKGSNNSFVSPSNSYTYCVTYTTGPYETQIGVRNFITFLSTCSLVRTYSVTELDCSTPATFVSSGGTYNYQYYTVKPNTAYRLCATVTSFGGTCNTHPTGEIDAEIYSSYFLAFNNTPACATASVGGTASFAGGTLCETNSGTVSLSGHTGSVIKWQTSTDGGTSWTDLAGTSTSYAFTNAINGQKFRAVVQTAANCVEAYSSAATISVTVCTDTDSDGIMDVTDIDDDNDGILDTSEKLVCSSANQNSTTGTGSGTYKNNLYWFNWTGAAFADGIQNGDSQTFTLADGTVVTATISNVVEITAGASAAFTPYDMNTWSGSLIWQLYNTTGVKEAFYNSSSGGQDISFNVNFTALKSGNAVPLNVVFTDAESTGGGNEDIIATTNGGTWASLESTGSGMTVTGEGTNTLTITNTTTGNKIYYSEGASNIGVTMHSGGAEGVAFGLLLYCDTDGDGVANYLDKDSDGDGCSDAYEAGATTNLTPNYAFPAPYGTNGLADAKETAVDNGVINYTSTYSNATNNTVKSCCPSVSLPSNQLVCNGTSVSAITFTGGITGTTYNWTNNTPSIGLAASGTGNIASFTGVNSGATAVTATITVTPSTASCTGSPQTFTITVKPDSDNDGICNDVDRDDDNDGILDTDEGLSNSNLSGLNASVDANGVSLTNTASLNCIAPKAGSGSKTMTFDVRWNNGAASLPASSILTVNIGGVNYLTIKTPSDGGSNADNATEFGGDAIITALNGAFFINSLPSAQGNSYINHTPYLSTTGLATITLTVPVAINTVNFNYTLNEDDFVVANATIVDACQLDTDGDNIPNHLDLDADNDGCSDAYEAGATTNLTPNYAFPAPYGANGLADAKETAVDNGTINYTPTYSNATNNTVKTCCPSVSLPSNQAVCNGTSVSAINFTGGITGTTYNWTNNTPSIGLAASGTGNIASFTGVNSGATAVTATITVTPSTVSCTGSPQIFTITINPTPSSPVVGTITQPTCATSTGSVALSGLPSTGSWTVTASPGGATLSGSGTTGTFTGLSAGTYTFVVTNSVSCISVASSSAVINSQPVTPSAPVVGTITQPTCATSTGSVALSGLPSTGSWTVTASPGGATLSGSGTTGTFTGLSAGTYTFRVTNSVGCQSVASSSAVVNPQPITPSVSAPSNQIICKGSTTAAIAFSGTATTYNWTNSNTSIGLAAIGTGNIAAFTGVNTTSFNQVATITVIPSTSTCTGSQQTFTITVKPDSDNDGICDDVDIDDDNDGITDSGECGAYSNPSGLSVTPYSNSLNYFTFTPTVTLNNNSTTSSVTLPSGTVTATVSHTGAAVNSINTDATRPAGIFLGIPSNSAHEGFRGVTGTQGQSYTLTYTFSRPIDITFFDAEKSDSSESYTATSNVGTVIEIIDSKNIGSVTLTGVGTNSVSLTSRVPISSPVSDYPVVLFLVRECSSITFNITQTSFGLTGLGVATYDFPCLDTDNDGIANSLDTDSDGDGCSDAYESGATTILTPNYSFPGPYGSNGLADAKETAVDNGLVNYTATYSKAIDNSVKACCPTVSIPSNQIVCAGGVVSAVTFSGSITGATYNWTNNNTTIGLGGSGSGNISSFTAINSGNTPQTGTITVTPSTASCTGTPQNFSITAYNNPNAPALAKRN